PLARTAQSGEQPEDGRIVGVYPPADGVNRALDLTVVFVNRAVLPEAVTMLMSDPVADKELEMFEPLEPHGTPSIAHDCRIGWTRCHRRPQRTPNKHLRHEASTQPMSIVLIAIVTTALCDDRLERRWPASGNLQGAEPAPRAAEHTHLAIAPGLLRDPVDD